MNRARLVLKMQKDGMCNEEIARRLGILLNTVQSYSWRARNWERYDQLQSAAGIRRRNKLGLRSRDEVWQEARSRAAPIIAAVDAGLSYAAVARKFGLKSRNVVAGIVSRRPESRGVER